MRIPLLLVAISLLAGCSATAPSTPLTSKSKVVRFKSTPGELPEIARSALVGTWYGRQQTHEGNIWEWITKRSDNGDFVTRFRTSRDGKLIALTAEVGEWGLSFDLEVVITRGWLVDGVVQPTSTDAYFWDIYRIEKVTPDMVACRGEGGNRNHYVEKRVPQDFDFPALSPR